MAPARRGEIERRRSVRCWRRRGRRRWGGRWGGDGHDTLVGVVGGGVGAEVAARIEDEITVVVPRALAVEARSRRSNIEDDDGGVPGVYLGVFRVYAGCI